MLTLTYPVISPTSTLVLRNPEFGNNDRQDFLTITRESRHGHPLGYHDANWPTMRTKFFNFHALTLVTINELKAFLLATAGLEIGLVDYNSESFTGYIITNENEIITMKDTCSYDVSFEFKY